MRLPYELETAIVDEMKKVKETKAMAELTTSIERYAMNKGITEGRAVGKAEGIAEGILQSIPVVLEIKFGEAGENLTQRVRQIQRMEVLQKFLESLKHASSLTEAETHLSELEQQFS